MKSGIAGIAAVLAVSAGLAETIRIEKTPFGPFETVVPEFRTQDFPITDYGAKEGRKNTDAFAAAMAACSAAGGGRVIVPRGTWLTGAVHFRSGCNLYLDKEAVLEFTDDPADYPKVHTTWEGVECLNHSPLLFAYGCTNVAITGSGLIRPRMAFWHTWFGRPPAHMYATECLYHWCSTNAPIASRDVMAIAGANVRPHLMQFNRCRNVLLDGFRVRESPFWVIHLYHSVNCVVRNLDVYAQGHNNDGVDIDMTKNVLVENCRFDEGDDGIVLKAGRNQDAWRLNHPTENVVVRNCDLSHSRSLLGIGSELAGGIRNVWMHDCRVDAAGGMIRLKTNWRRGGFVENVYVERCTAGAMQWVFNIDTDVLYQWAKFPDYERRYTRIRNLNMSDCSCDEVNYAVWVHGDRHLPPSGIRLKNIRINKVWRKVMDVENCDDIVLDNVTVAKDDGRKRGYGSALPFADWIRELSPAHSAAVEFLSRRDLGSLPPGRYPLDGLDAWVEITDERLVSPPDMKFETDDACDTLICSPQLRYAERCRIGEHQKECGVTHGSYVYIPAGVPFAPRIVFGTPGTARRVVAKARVK